MPDDTININIDNLTLGQVKQLKCLLGGSEKGCASSPFIVGKAYFIRTVTMAWTGKVVSIDQQFLVLEKAAWIADTGRYNEFVAKGSAQEVEPVSVNVIIGVGSIVDAVEFVPVLPRDVK